MNTAGQNSELTHRAKRSLCWLPAALIRSWIIFASNQRAIVLPCVLILLLVLSLAVFSGETGAVWWVAVIITAALTGAGLAALNFGFFVNRAVLKLDPLNPNRDIFNHPQESTGLKVLDRFLEAHRRYISHLLQTIATMGEEAESLVERYELLTENLAASVIIRDASNKIVYGSPYTEVLTGYSLAEIYDAKDDFFLAIVHEKDLDTIHRALAVSAAGEPFQYRYRFYHKSGMEIWVETRTVPIIGDDGEVTSSLSVTLDVTGTVRYQKQVEEKNKDLQDFTYMVTHDLKAPIATVKGMVNVLNEDYAKNLPEDSKEVIHHIGNAAERLHNLVGSILEYSRIAAQSISPTAVNLSEVMQDVLSDYSTQIKDTHTIIDVPQSFPSVLGGKTQMYQILSNLVGNAIKYRSPEKPLRLTISAKEAAFRRRVTLIFSDNGLGIPDDKIDSIFRPFQRAHGSEIEGNGIGLACVKKLTEKLGGTISVQSTLGKGSTFSLELPCKSG